MKKLSKLLCAIAVGGFMFQAAAWEPSSEVKVIVAYKAGSGTDTGARVLSSMAEKFIGQPLVINNLPGADGKIGWTALIKAKPDGQTIGFINLPTFTTLATLNNAPFSVKDVIPVCNHLTETSVVVVNADSPYKTLKDLVAAAVKDPNLRCSTNGVKASNHTAAQLLAKSADFKYKAIPYGGTADQLLALRQKEVNFSCAKVADVAPLIKGDKPELRVLGVFSEERLKNLPDVPTLKELGYYDKWYGSARGLVLPAGTPDDVVKFYVDTFKKVMSDKAVQEAHEKAGLELDFMDNVAFGELISKQEKFCKEEISQLY
ncbi:MAG: tripartite tricarboxylate transporter substrate binding protein [Succinivibrio sp.]|nr:tripartite tricarboxylate transporter substrate binding protein [Succinivibrio sp.]